jgi:putative Mg2+ transporter-C (MgtC) family protein
LAPAARVGYFRRVFGTLRALLPVPWSEIVLAAIAFLCGAVVGVERERNDKPAGLRTLVLICVGSAVFTMVSLSPALGLREPARVAAQIVTGVGFLGAGSIIREGSGIIGMTTAASIWATAGVGMVVGAGYAAAGVVLSLIILLTLVALKRLEEWLAGPCQLRQVLVRYRPDSGKTSVRLQQIVDRGRGPVRVSPERAGPTGSSEMVLSYCSAHREHRNVVGVIAELPEVESMSDQPRED